MRKSTGLLILALLVGLGQIRARESKVPDKSKTGDSPKVNGSLLLPTFSDIAVQAGIRFRHQASCTPQKHMIEPMAGGVACLDFDSDGLVDFFFVNGAALADPMPKRKLPDKSAPRYWNRLYRNTGHEKFVDVTEQAGLQGNGYGMGVAVVGSTQTYC